ncbi:MAG: type I-E CRISPR-associated protein Cse2/CasB [Cellulomonas sp.]|nr:type I-E CRISPR-associated protein Cse2/CasB [Cellulomonas sp.]
MTASTSAPPDLATPERHERTLAVAVAARAAQLQAASIRQVGDAVARIARLRRAVGAAPGAEPDVWDDTIGLVPRGELGRGDDPSRAETAAHVAMTLFAVHRQGKCVTAHVQGVSFGRAVRALSRHRGRGQDESEGVRRRFDAVLTSDEPEEALYHLRGLVLLLRDAQIALDYGRLASDLVDLWTPARADTLRLRWARDYRRSAPDQAADQTTTTTSTTDEEQA